jgi:molecular chaperone DnaK
VTFDIDANGIVHVSAKDRGTGREQSMTITGGSALPKDDIDRMMRDAESHAEEDRKRREEAETRNQAEALVYQTERFLADNTEALEKVPADTKTETESALTELKKSLEGADFEAIKSGSERLAQASSALGTAIYAAAGPVPGSEGADDAGFSAGADDDAGADEDVVDAEIVDEDDA